MVGRKGDNVSMGLLEKMLFRRMKEYASVACMDVIV
jgi:hypothetical protein